ncbi:FtsX-like permease family protein [candidate division KSB1 bacterium]
MSGLAVGMAFCVLLLLHVQYELSYDKYHENKDRIYRIVHEYTGRDGKVQTGLTFPGKFTEILKSDLPEIKNTMRLYSYSWREKALVKRGSNQFYEDRFFLADPSILKIFTFPLIKGNPDNALNKDNALLITEKMAEKYFGDEDPIGKTLTITHVNTMNFEITGVLKNIPGNSHFKFDFLAPLESNKYLYWTDLIESESYNFYTYLLISEQSKPDFLQQKFQILSKRYPEIIDENDKLFLQPVTSIHLHSSHQNEIEQNGDISDVYLFTILAAIILLTACINFINLSTARSAVRAKEVAMRKVAGANRVQLALQFLGESILYTLIALPFSLIIVELLLPVFNNIIGTDLYFDLFDNPIFLIYIVLLTILVGIISGSYPSFLVSKQQPQKLIKGESIFGIKKAYFRNILVVSQFTVSVVFITGTIIISKQMSFVKNKKLGFDKEQIVIIPLKDDAASNMHMNIKNEFLNNPAVLQVSVSDYLPSSIRLRHRIWYEGYQGSEDKWINCIAVDYDFINTYGIKLYAGRNFSKDFTTDATKAYIINEAAARDFEWESAVGKQFQISNKGLARQMYERGTIIGVVKDFHFRSLHRKIEPLVLNIYPSMYRFISVKIQPGNLAGTLSYLKQSWKNIIPNRPFEYFFFDEEFDKMYRAENKMNKIFTYSALLTIFIASLGLFGLASFITEKRTREIGIRKVLGASISNVILNTSKEFFILIAGAIIIALPFSYFIMNKWLQNFEYRITMNIGLFIYSALTALVVAAAAVSYQVLKVANTNPVDSIKYE